MRAALYLLTLPALGLGWLVGSGPPDRLASQPSPTKTVSPRDHAPAADLPDFLEPDSTGREPSFVDVSLRILKRTNTASPNQLARLRHEVNDARYETHPGYDPTRWVVNELYRLRLPYRYMEERTDSSSRVQFFQQWGARDLRAAFQAALTADPPGQRAYLLTAALRLGGEHDPEKALELVRSIADPGLRELVGGTAALAALKKDPTRYIELAKEFPLHADHLYNYGFDRMARTDPKAALARLEELPPSRYQRARDAIVAAWAETDHAAAFRWATENNAPLPKNLFHYWVAEDPIPALETALHGGLKPWDLVHQVTTIMPGARGEMREEIVTWLGNIEDQSLRARLTAGLFDGEDPPSAAELGAASFAAEHPNAVLRDLSKFVNRIENPTRRREWIQSLPPRVGRTQMAWQAGEWLRDDAADFARYVEAMPSRRARESFLRQALNNGNYEHRDRLRQFATGAGIEVDQGTP